MNTDSIPAFSEKELLSDDHILEELAGLILLSSEAATGSLEKIKAERRIYELEDEIDIRGAARHEMDMEDPIPSKISRDKLLALTDRFGVGLIGWNDDFLEKWDIPLANKWYRDGTQWFTIAEENPYSGIADKFSVLVDDVQIFCDKIGTDYEDQNGYLDCILEAIKTCEACWDAEKRTGITGEIKFFANISAENNSAFVSSVYMDLMSVPGDKFIPASHFCEVMEHLHLYAREAALASIAREKSIEGDDVGAAKCVLGAGSACIIRTSDDIWKDMNTSEISPEVQSRYFAIKGRAYEHVHQSPSFLPEEIERIDIDFSKIYRDASLFGTNI